MNEAFWKYLRECYANNDAPIDSPDEELKTIRIMETDQVAKYLHNIAELKKLQDKTKWQNGLHTHMENIKAAKEAHEENVAKFVVQPDGREEYLVKFKYKGHRTNEDVEEMLPVTAEWIEKKIKPEMKEYIRAMTLDLNANPNGFVSIPAATEYLDQRHIIKVKYTPARKVNGRVVRTLRQSMDQKIKGKNETLYKRKHESRTIPEQWIALFHDKRSILKKSRRSSLLRSLACRIALWYRGSWVVVMKAERSDLLCLSHPEGRLPEHGDLLQGLSALNRHRSTNREQQIHVSLLRLLLPCITQEWRVLHTKYFLQA
jgi:hypothetical protein